LHPSLPLWAPCTSLPILRRYRLPPPFTGPKDPLLTLKHGREVLVSSGRPGHRPFPRGGPPRSHICARTTGLSPWTGLLPRPPRGTWSKKISTSLPPRPPSRYRLHNWSTSPRLLPMDLVKILPPSPCPPCPLPSSPYPQVVTQLV